MSTALAIAGVTAVLRDLLNDGLVNHNISGVIGSTVTVTALPPDRVTPTGGVEGTQLNIFLHQVTPNTAWRNEALPSRDGSGRQRLSNPPLAIDLHYLITAYGAEELHAEILLGYAMQLLHERPVLDRDAIRVALSPSPIGGGVLPPALLALSDSGLADQVELIRLTPQVMGSEEMSRLWSALQARYRPTAAYRASVVLIESRQPAHAALPVLTRGPRDLVTGRERGVVVQPHMRPATPTIDLVSGFGGDAIARLDDVVTLEGIHLDGTSREVVLEHERLGIVEVLTPTNASDTTTITFAIPVARAADLAAGVYRLTARLVRPGESVARTTNAMALAVVPHLVGLPMTVASAGGTATIGLTAVPHVRPGQVASLVLGQREVTLPPVTSTTGALTAIVTSAAPGNHLARLRVDGLDSPIIDRTAVPPEFLNQRIQIT